MRTLQRYIAVDFLVIFGLALLLSTFVMCIGAVFKAVDFAVKGLSVMIIVKYFVFNLPYLLMFTIPLSMLMAVLLLFMRLSMDGEITAMKASGLSMWQIISSIIVISILLSFACIYINSYLAPEGHFARRKVVSSVGIEDPMSLLEEGQFVRDFPNMMVYVSKKSGNKVKDVRVIEFDPRGRVIRRVRANTAVITPGEQKHTLIIDMTNVRIEQMDKNDPLDPSKANLVISDNYRKPLDYSQLMGSENIKKKIKDMTLMELVRATREVREAFPELRDEDLAEQRMRLVLESNKRLALSLACFAFTLIGIPLGIRSRRRESTIGIAISLALVFVFYFFIILAEALVEMPHLRPDLIVWAPVLLFEVLGFMQIQKSN